MRRLPRCARLTLLFSFTTVLVAAGEILVLKFINDWCMEQRVQALSLGLLLFGLLLLSAAVAEASFSDRMDFITNRNRETT